MTPKEAIIRKELEKLTDTHYEPQRTEDIDAAMEVIKQVLTTPPTVDEVIEALKDFFKNSKFHNYIDTVYYSKEGKYFYTEDENRNLVEKIFDNYYIHEIKPQLITLIGKFYESLEGEKWEKQ